MIRSSRLSRLVGGALLSVLVGCDDTDNKGWLVDRTRVLGARIEAKSDAARAAINPGEPMRVTWLVGAPNGTGRLNWAYAVCPPALGNFPEPKCTGPIFSAARGASDGELVSMDIDAPGGIDDLEELQILAAFCENGEATLDAARFEATCAGGAAPRLASASVRLARSGPNKNPEIAADAILFDGSPLVPSVVRSGSSCVPDATSPLVNAGSKHAIVVRLRGDEREAIASQGFERLLVSHVVTAGELERQYSMLEPNDPAPKDLSVEWTAPLAPSANEGRLIEIYVVVRDGRGGAAFARRTVCVRQ